MNGQNKETSCYMSAEQGMPRQVTFDPSRGVDSVKETVDYLGSAAFGKGSASKIPDDGDSFAPPDNRTAWP